MRFCTWGKLSLQYIGSFDVLECISQVAYCLALPPHLLAIHYVFHVSVLKEYCPNNSHIINFQEIELQPNLTYPKDAVKIINHGVKTLRCREVPLVWVQWTGQGVEECKWEHEEEIMRRYLELFKQPSPGPGISTFKFLAVSIVLVIEASFI